METIEKLTQNSYLANTLQLFLNPTPYFLAVVFIFLIIFFYGMRSGRGRMILMLLSLYISIVLTGLFPFRNYLSETIKAGEPYFLELGLFVVSFLIVFVILLNSSLRVVALKSRGHFFQVSILSVLILGVFVSHLTVLLPVEILAELNHPVFTYFKTETAQFWWALAGIIFLAVMKRRGE